MGSVVDTGKDEQMYVMEAEQNPLSERHSCFFLAKLERTSSFCQQGDVMSTTSWRGVAFLFQIRESLKIGEVSHFRYRYAIR